MNTIYFETLFGYSIVKIFWLPTFFRIYFLFHKRKKKKVSMVIDNIIFIYFIYYFFIFIWGVRWSMIFLIKGKKMNRFIDL